MTAPIARRRLGRTGLQVTELGLGGVFVRTAVTAPGEGVRVVRRALELGVNYLDTAPLYGDSQQVLGDALQDIDAPYVLGAKCGRWDWETGPYRSLDAFKRQFEQTQRDLRRDAVDILYIHEADWGPYWTDMSVPRTAQFLDADAEYDFDGAPVAAFLRWVKDQGMTRFLGISGNNAHLLAKVLREMETPIDVVLTAFQYSSGVAQRAARPVSPRRRARRRDRAGRTTAAGTAGPAAPRVASRPARLDGRGSARPGSTGCTPSRLRRV